MSYRALLASASFLSAIAIAAPSHAVFFFVTSGSIDGSLCVGNDCVSSESFGFDTIRLKENNLRLHFDDTSTSASFPNQDWRLIANDSANGGAEHFTIEDATTGNDVIRAFAGARNNALVVDAQGEVGVGTSAPVLDVHIKTGDSPGLRLEQDGTSGFTPQSFDIAGNEANFFVRDVTNGSTLPFKIKPGAPSNALFVAANGDIGLGTQNPDADLNVVSSDQEALHIEGNGVKIARLSSQDNSAVQLRLQSNIDNNRRILAVDSSDNTETQISMNNDAILLAGPTVGGADLWATVSASGIVTNIGSCTSASPCDAVFDPDVYTVPSIEEHAAAMWANMYLPAVGPTVQGEPVNMNDRMNTLLNELEHAHIYIEQLHHRVASLEEQLLEAPAAE